MTEPVEPSVTVADAGPTSDPPRADDAADPEETSSSGKVWYTLLGLSAMTGLLCSVLAFTISLPYLALEPGSTFETEEYVVIDGTASYTSPGEVSFVTVTQRRLTPARWLLARLDDGSEIFHEDELLRGRTLDEQREENAQLMITSQNTAIAAALGHLGFETAEPAGAVIVDVVEGGPLDGVLARNDVISSVDGRPVVEILDLTEYLITQLDTTVEIVAARPGEEQRVVTVELTSDTSGFLGVAAGEDPAGDRGGAYIADIVVGGAAEGTIVAGDRVVGVDGSAIANFDELGAALAQRRAGEVITIELLRDSDGVEELVVVDIALGVRVLERAGISRAATQLRDAELPIDVQFTTDDIGGPSAGLAFTLTVLDVLTEGDLTGGADIVVTGSIDRAGNIGPIGGVHQKAFAARDAGADIFLVPDANFEEADAAVDDLRIEPVATLDDALEIIGEFGGNATDLPTADEL